MKRDALLMKLDARLILLDRRFQPYLNPVALRLIRRPGAEEGDANTAYLIGLTRFPGFFAEVQRFFDPFLPAERRDRQEQFLRLGVLAPRDRQEQFHGLVALLPGFQHLSL